MFTVKLRRIGNSLGIVLPKDVINRLQVTAGQALHLLEGAHNTFQLSTCDPHFEHKMLEARQVMNRYRNSLRALEE